MTKSLKYYTLYQCGPDNRSTYAECFGCNSGRGRERASGRTDEIASVIQEANHQNFTVRRHPTRGVRGCEMSVSEFRAEAAGQGVEWS